MEEGSVKRIIEYGEREIKEKERRATERFIRWSIAVGSFMMGFVPSCGVLCLTKPLTNTPSIEKKVEEPTNSSTEVKRYINPMSKATYLLIDNKLHGAFSDVIYAEDKDTVVTTMLPGGLKAKIIGDKIEIRHIDVNGRYTSDYSIEDIVSPEGQRLAADYKAKKTMLVQAGLMKE